MTKSKAYITMTKPKFLQKVIQTNIKIEDAFQERYKNHITVFIPKLKPHFLTPCCMVNFTNGRSATLFRCKTPLALADTFDTISNVLRSTEWLETWRRLNDTSEDIMLGETQLVGLNTELYDHYG